ncbi:complex I subunit 4 family protein [Salarchaeum japonicum]|uniref:complex I subunit 4 family protein n=1 Tax=Salarchaeum japonicum TaxID=555573 RepID=UPI003C766CB8
MLIEALLAVTFLSAICVIAAPEKWAAKLGFALSLLPLAGSLLLYSRYDGAGNALLQSGTPAFETTRQWISFGEYALQWHVGLDGISLPLVLLTAVMTTIAIVTAWSYIDERRSEFYALLLFTEASLFGVFAALDFFVWFVFWEFVLVPLYLLISVWGGPRRTYAAIKFFVYTNVASLVLFIGFMLVVFASPVQSFDLAAVAAAVRGDELTTFYGLAPDTITTVAFFALFFGFAVKTALVPFHTWLPDAYTEAPTPVTLVLAGVVTKMGTYSLLRFNVTMFPETTREFAPFLGALAVITVLYGSFVAVSQQDLKRIVAYTSIPSMGFVLLGLVTYTTYGLAGATFQMVSHGLLIGVLFLAVGAIERSADTRMVDKLSGVASEMPVTASVFVAGAFGYMGLPLMSGFAAEFFIFTGSFQAGYENAALFTAVAMFGIVIIAGYLLWTMQRVLFGPYEVDTDAAVADPARIALAPGVVLILLAIGLGVAPDAFMGMIQDSVNAILGGGV